MKNGKIIGVGVGPGDPDLLTVKAVRALQEVDVVFAPTADSSGHSLALSIVSQVLERRRSAPEVITLVFPMIKDKTKLERAWARNAGRIAKSAMEGKLVAFVAVGDPTLYSTFTYVQRVLKSKYPEIPVEIIPGVTSISACMARARVPLAFGEETLLITPRLDMSMLKEESRLVDNIVWMKGIRKLPQTIKTLKKSGRFTDKSQIVIAKRCSFSDEELWKGEIGNANTLNMMHDYFATLMIRRRPSYA